MSLSSTPLPHPQPEESVAEVAALPRWVVLLFVVAFVLVGYLLFASYAERQAMRKGLDDADKKSRVLGSELEKTNTQLADLKGQLQVTSQKLGLTQDELAQARSLSASLKRQQEVNNAKLREQIGAVEQDTSAKLGQVATDISGTKSDVAATKADLEATKGKLSSTIGDLGVQSGLIARNHDEVEELKRLGERDIFEFTLSKSSKGPQHVGPIQASLRKVDPKKYRYTMNVLADDKSIEKKDKTAGEPVQFYVQGARAPYEIVVFNISKDNMTGYLSTPKDASGGSSGGPAPAPAKP
jgi:hypothetical protein